MFIAKSHELLRNGRGECHRNTIHIVQKGRGGIPCEFTAELVNISTFNTSYRSGSRPVLSSANMLMGDTIGCPRLINVKIS